MFRGDAADARSRSGIVTLRVRPDTRRSTSLSIRISRVAVDPGGTAVVSGVLLGAGHPLADRRVILQRRPVGDASWHDARGKRTGPHGFVAFVVRPPTRTHFRLVFLPHPDFRGSRSGVVTLNVRTPTVLGARGERDQRRCRHASHAHRHADDGGRSRLPGRTVTLLCAARGQHQRSRRWRPLPRRLTEPCTFSVAPQHSTRYVLISPRSYLLTASRSAGLTVLVKLPSSLSIRAVKDTVASGESDTIGGTLLGTGW